MFYYSIYLSKNKARDLYELLKDIPCPKPDNYCYMCSRHSGCHEFRNMLKALEDYFDEREE